MLSPTVYEALSWVFFVIALSSFILRISIHQRYKLILDRRLVNSDFAAAVALLFLLAHGVLAVLTARNLSYLSDNSLTQSHNSRPDLAEALSNLLKHQLPLTLLFTSALWAIKFEFLYLLYNLVIHLRPLQRAWLCIFAATVFTYLTSLLYYPISTVDCGSLPLIGRFTGLTCSRWVSRTQSSPSVSANSSVQRGLGHYYGLSYCRPAASLGPKVLHHEPGRVCGECFVHAGTFAYGLCDRSGSKFTKRVFGFGFAVAQYVGRYSGQYEYNVEQPYGSKTAAHRASEGGRSADEDRLV